MKGFLYKSLVLTISTSFPPQKDKNEKSTLSICNLLTQYFRDQANKNTVIPLQKKKKKKKNEPQTNFKKYKQHCMAVITFEFYCNGKIFF